mmetsp:Transcript_36206/g.87643  ORF Transcript_36206/g.87643 Transcript_36206/m.87643 type:complete len:84 (-) Transcript_36206:23-274(-)
MSPLLNLAPQYHRFPTTRRMFQKPRKKREKTTTKKKKSCGSKKSLHMLSKLLFCKLECCAFCNMIASYFSLTLELDSIICIAE